MPCLRASQVTNHDVKAVEYFLKRKFDGLGLGRHKEFIHFALTSQDVNHVALPLMLRDALEHVYCPALRSLVGDLRRQALVWDAQPMLARTHGQPATPTRMGKEVMVFVERLENQLALLEALPLGCKLGGATGNCAAHEVAYPDIDWEGRLTALCSRLGLARQR
jgi:adenylosuccinate lyase